MFDVDSMFLDLNDLDRDYTHQETWRTNSLLCFYYAAIYQLLAYERVPRNAAYTYCDSKDRRLSDTKKIDARLP